MSEKRARAIAALEDRQDEESFLATKQLIERELAAGETPELLVDYGYVHEAYGRSLVRSALARYERALELDPDFERAHRQPVGAHAGLRQTQDAIDRYKRHLAQRPTDVASYRLLASAYLSGGAYEDAAEVVEAGLELEPEDEALLEQQGNVLVGRGRADEALLTWLRAFELDPERGISTRYSRVFLLQRLGRLEEAAAEWEGIVGWLRERGYDAQAEWPERELARVRGLLDAPPAAD